MRRFAALVCLPLLSAAVPTAPSTEGAWDCKFTSRVICSPTGQCNKGDPARSWIYLTPSQNSYWRCEGKGFDNCDQHKAFVSTSGAYRTFELPGHAAFAKVGPDLQVTEVLALMQTVYINRGHCIIGPPPLIRTDR